MSPIFYQSPHVYCKRKKKMVVCFSGGEKKNMEVWNELNYWELQNSNGGERRDERDLFDWLLSKIFG